MVKRGHDDVAAFATPPSFLGALRRSGRTSAPWLAFSATLLVYVLHASRHRRAGCPFPHLARVSSCPSAHRHPPGFDFRPPVPDPPPIYVRPWCLSNVRLADAPAGSRCYVYLRFRSCLCSILLRAFHHYDYRQTDRQCRRVARTRGPLAFCLLPHTTTSRVAAAASRRSPLPAPVRVLLTYPVSISRSA